MTTVVMRGTEPWKKRQGIAVPIVVIISQMRRAKLELCPSPSGWLTVTNSSLIPLINYTQAKGALRGRRLRRPLSTCHPRLQHKDTMQRSVFSPYHRCPPSVSLRAGGSLSSCLWPLLLCEDVMYLIVSLRFDQQGHADETVDTGTAASEDISCALSESIT